MPATAVSEFAVAVARDWAAQFAQLLESMTGNPARAAVTDAPEASSLVWFDHRFVTASRSQPFAVGIEPGTCLEIGRELLCATGIEERSPDECRRACSDAVAETTGRAARALGAHLGVEVKCEGGGSRGSCPAGGSLLFGVAVNWHGCELRTFAVAIPPELGALDPGAAAPALFRVAVSAPPNAKAFDVLMEIDLPVTISFGRAELPLQEVLRLASGSIIELNRSASDPVDVIVNNCVIARGDVVVIDGNYGIRIQEIASRQERLKTVS